MLTPRCVEHNSEMNLTCTEIRAFAEKGVVDIYSCSVSGCAIRYAQKLGGYGFFIEAGRFVLIEERTL